MTNGLSHPYHLDESTFIFRGIGSTVFLLLFFFSFSDEVHLSKQNSPRWDAAFCGVAPGSYSVCLCLIKRMPGLYEPRHEKTGFLHMRKQRRSDREADQRLCFRYTDSTSHLLKYEINFKLLAILCGCTGRFV